MNAAMIAIGLPLSGGVVLVVDDDPLMQMITKDILEYRGCAVHTADDAQQALTLLDEITPDLIFLDVFLPSINGIELCHMIRERDDCLGVPIIMTGAIGMPEAQQRALDAGANKYFTKPFRISDLF